VKLPDLPEFVARYRFCFSPIRYTSLGLGILETMAVGVPVVGMATTELPSVFRDGRNGYVSNDPAKLAARMRALLADHELARRLGEAGAGPSRPATTSGDSDSSGRTCCPRSLVAAGADQGPNSPRIPLMCRSRPGQVPGAAFEIHPRCRTSGVASRSDASSTSRSASAHSARRRS
jgi:hypothetical protein